MEVEKAEKLKQKQEKKSKANVKQEIKQKSKSLLKTTCPKNESNKNLSKKRRQECELNHHQAKVK